MDICENVAKSEEYADFMVDYLGYNAEQFLERYEDFCPINVGSGIDILYNRIDKTTNRSMLMLSDVSYKALPKLYGEMDIYVGGVTGAIQLQNTAGLMLDGLGVIIGIIDSGIDYTNDVFRYSSGETRIIEIWDQSADEINPPERYRYGNIYTREEINNALSSDNPRSIVNVTDETGHGTFMTGIAAGNKDYANNFTGMAPEADIMVVKLKPAKKYLRDFYMIKEDAVAYQENDIIAGIDYLERKASMLGMPLVICLGVGTGSGARLGRTFLDRRIDEFAYKARCCITVPAGNEGNQRHHYSGRIENEGVKTVEIRADRSFTLELWARSPDIIAVSVTSPSGESIPRIPARLGQSEVLRFLFEDTVIYVDYKIIEQTTGEELIMMRFMNPTSGVWKVEVYGSNIVNGVFNAWLPIRQFSGEGVFFLEPDPNETLTPPADAQGAITMAGFNSESNGVYVASGRGYTSNREIKPDMTAPAVNITGPISGGRFGSRTGTSIASAVCAGAAAQLFQWGVVKGNLPDMNSQDVKNFLVRGAVRIPGVTYPNRESGYGQLNVYKAFDIFR